MSEEGKEPPATPSRRSPHDWAKPGERRRAAARLIAVAAAETAFLLVAALLTMQVRPDLMEQFANGISNVMTPPTPTALPQPTATPTPVPLPTTTPVPALPGATAQGDFPTYLGYEGTGYNPAETSITAATAPQLKVVWTQHGASTISTQPTVANGLIYWGDWSGDEHATTLAGKTVWTTNLGRTWPDVLDPCGFSYDPNPGVTSTASIATVAGRSMAFLGGGTGQVAALDALTGKILWQTQLGVYQQGFVWASPSVYGGSVYVALASFSDCPLVQGEVVRLDAASGAIRDVFKIVPDGCLGGTVYGSPTVDPVEGYVYVATGGPNVYGGPCANDGPYTSSVLKLRASDLRLSDHWQVPPAQQAEDGDFGNTPTLFSYSLDRVTYEMLGITHKNGIFYAFNRERLGSGPVWERQVSLVLTPGIYSPASFDGTHLYVTGTYEVIGRRYCSSSIRALDPRTGADVWARCLDEGYVYGAVTSAPGIVVVGAGPWTVVMASDTGATLFEYRDPGGTRYYAAASVAHGLLLQGNTDGTLFAFGVRRGYPGPA